MANIVVTILTGCGAQGSSFNAGGTVRSQHPISSITAQLTNGQTINGTPQTPPSGYDWYFSFSSVPAGSYTLTVTATDDQGNHGAAECPVTVS